MTLCVITDCPGRPGHGERRVQMEQGNRTDEVWVLGATGRTGRAVAARLAADGVPPVLVGRNRGRLERVGATLGLTHGPKAVVAGTPEAIAAEISRQRPAVVVNTLGDYARTALPIARACLPGGHYVDLAADVPAMLRLAALHPEAQGAGSTLVTGAGFGVLGTQAVVTMLGEGARRPAGSGSTPSPRWPSRPAVWGGARGQHRRRPHHRRTALRGWPAGASPARLRLVPPHAARRRDRDDRRRPVR
nr:hypothetical protein GCM10025730_51870 [Promicromonospora thailandica]